MIARRSGHRSKSRQSGMTLVEVISVLMLMVMVTVLLSEITISALRVFDQSRAEQAQRSDAELTFDRVVPTLRLALAVNAITASSVDVTLPLKDASGNNSVGYTGVQPGNRVKYFVGNNSGTENANGTYLWQQVGALISTDPLASGFQSCAFASLTDSGGRTTGVRMTLTYSGIVMGVRTVTHTYTQEVTFRNIQ